jgi:mRNA-degrading endonuclease toxin of MazEF toxin-antitoxin module
VHNGSITGDPRLDGNNLKKDSEILVLQVRTISKKRLSKKIGNITKDQVEQIKQGIDLYLNY